MKNCPKCLAKGWAGECGATFWQRNKQAIIWDFVVPVLLFLILGLGIWKLT